MNLLVIRHAIAEEKDEFAKTGKSDDFRPLTVEGREKMARAAEGLANIVPQISLLASSPLTRARETADIVGKAFKITSIPTTEVLRPEADYRDFLEWLGDHMKKPVVAVVGHEPHLSELVTWLMCGTHESRIDLKKGAAVLLTLDEPEPASARLCWALTPGLLRRLR